MVEIPLQKISRNATAIESPSPASETSTQQHAEGMDNKAQDTSGDLGSIVTLVGKSSGKRVMTSAKQNETSVGGTTIENGGAGKLGGGEEINAQKKTMETSERLAAQHTQRNASSVLGSETNAANVNQVAGPSNSIIVSSVIVVLVASFVVVGMAVVAVVAVVARHCNLSTHLQTGS